MLSKLLKPKACLDEESTLWLFDTFAWALRNWMRGYFMMRLFW
jgi:hypothetical protein